MAKFTFGTGNAQALRRLPLYLLGAIATLLVPRTDRVWAFGCGIGPGEGALPLYRLARERLGANVRTVWLATTPTELERARDLGMDAVLKLSARGLWLTLRARVCVVTHGLGDVNRYGVRGAFVVQLWHGVPLKKLHLDSPAALRSAVLGNSRLVRALLARGIRAAGAQIQLFPVASERIVGRISSAFGVSPERIAVTGDPRDDVLLAGTPDERREAAMTLLEKAIGAVPPSARVVLYAPTWRDGERDPSAPDAATWDEIATWLDRTNTVLIVRVHPLGHGDYAAGLTRSSRIRMLTAEMINDVNPVLPAVDAIVTDYSSIAFDFALLDRPTVFLAPDLETYTRSRGMYEPYRTFSGGRHAVAWTHVLEQLDALTDPSTSFAAEIAAHTRWLREEHFDFADGNATERVFAEIQRRLVQEVAISVPATRSRPTVTAVAFEPGLLRIELDAPVSALRLDGPRSHVDASVTVADGQSVAEFPLLVARWGVPGLALPSGDYRLALIGETSTTRIALGVTATDTLEPLYRARVVAEDGGVLVRVGPPFSSGEQRPSPHRPPTAGYGRARVEPENAIYFESFYGRAACDNPLGIDRVIARDHPEVRRYWSVADGSVAVPPGAIRLVVGSAEWWRLRAAARVLVVNDWLTYYFHRRPHQHVLQTWHGTMLKKLALDRPDMSRRRRLAIARQSRRWDALLAQNEYSAAIFRSSYAFNGPIWTTGYPRNDVLGDAARAEAVRNAIGLAGGVHAVLYAPTWRDDRDEMVDYLDLAEFAASLPADHVLLVRGHSRTLGFGQDVRAAQLIDVTSYPDVADLMLVADQLVTDYSSVMFDFAATGKPMVFYTPDIAHYGDVLRGFYFDLLADAPGPVVTTADELRAAIADPRPAEFAAKYAGWQARFTALDDGHAAERVVARLYAEGWLD
ncbi:MAG TPA: CDP-glycerol glycerophosphotransferase family protein [Jatrophihabitantaceae bacterium]|nr:CDP-glycerol glycerophosphotransferase family protein [Jatrophihabitantaceae bacterium]